MDDLDGNKIYGKYIDVVGYVFVMAMKHGKVVIWFH